MSFFVKRIMIKIREIYKMAYEVFFKINAYITGDDIQKY